jgi:hypothetical protein
VSLLAQSPTQVSEISTGTVAKGTLFNDIRIGHYTGQVDVPITAAEEQEMLKTVSDHRGTWVAAQPTLLKLSGDDGGHYLCHVI